MCIRSDLCVCLCALLINEVQMWVIRRKAWICRCCKSIKLHSALNNSIKMIREKRADERQCVCDCVGVIGRQEETAGKNDNDSETHLNHPPNQSENHTHSVSSSFPPTHAYKYFLHNDSHTCKIPILQSRFCNDTLQWC